MTSETDIIFDRDPEAVYLLSLLNDLLDAFCRVQELMDTHMKAVASQDVVRMEVATQDLIDHYDSMATIKKHFYEHIDTLCRQFGIPADSRKLSALVDYFPDFQEEIDTGRTELIEKVNSVQAQKDRLMGLLDKARNFNKDTMQLVRTARDGKSVRYDGLGEKSLSDDSSIIFNQKA